MIQKEILSPYRERYHVIEHDEWDIDTADIRLLRGSFEFHVEKLKTVNRHSTVPTH